MTKVSLSAHLAELKAKNGPDTVMDYAKTTGGAGRITGFFQKLLKTLGFWGYSSSQMKKVEGDLGTAGSVFGLFGAPKAVADARDSLNAMSDDTVCLSRRVANLASDGFGALAAVGFAATFLTGMVIWIPFARAADLLSDMADVQISASNYNEATQLEGKVSGEEKEAVAHSKEYYLSKTIVKTVSAALGVIGFAILASGVSFVSGVTLTVVSLALGAFAIKTDLFKDPRKAINFDRTIVVEPQMA